MEQAEAVAADVARGFPIHLALSRVHRDLTLPAWNDALAGSTILSRHYQQKLADGVAKVLDMLPGRTMRELPAEIWGLSRGVLRDHFVEGKTSGGQTNVFNGPTQINVNSRAAVRALLRKVTTPPPDEPKHIG